MKGGVCLGSQRKARRINVTIDEDTYMQIKAIADKNNVSLSEVVRQWVYEGLNGQVSADNLNLITRIIREQLSGILNPKIERLAALGAKTCTMAAASTFLAAETISKFVPPGKTEAMKEVYEKAKQKGILYTQNRTTDEGYI